MVSWLNLCDRLCRWSPSENAHPSIVWPFALSLFSYCICGSLCQARKDFGLSPMGLAQATGAIHSNHEDSSPWLGQGPGSVHQSCYLLKSDNWFLDCAVELWLSMKQTFSIWWIWTGWCWYISVVLSCFWLKCGFGSHKNSMSYWDYSSFECHGVFDWGELWIFFPA